MKLKNRIIAAIAAASIAIPAIAVATYKDKGGSKLASFSSVLRPDEGIAGKTVGKAAAGSKIEGSTSAVTFAEEGDKVVVRVDLKDLDTGMGMRNDHMRNKLLNKKYGAELSIAKSALKSVTKPNGTVDGAVDGTLRLNFDHGKKDGGTSKGVKVKLSSKEDGGGLKVNGSTTFNYRDFYKWDGKAEAACNMGICVADTISINVTLAVTKDQ